MAVGTFGVVETCGLCIRNRHSESQSSDPWMRHRITQEKGSVSSVAGATSPTGQQAASLALERKLQKRGRPGVCGRREDAC